MVLRAPFIEGNNYTDRYSNVNAIYDRMPVRLVRFYRRGCGLVFEYATLGFTLF